MEKANLGRGDVHGPRNDSHSFRCSLSCFRFSLAARALWERLGLPDALFDGEEPFFLRLGMWQEIDPRGAGTRQRPGASPRDVGKHTERQHRLVVDAPNRMYPMFAPRFVRHAMSCITNTDVTTFCTTHTRLTTLADKQRRHRAGRCSAIEDTPGPAQSPANGAHGPFRRRSKGRHAAARRSWRGRAACCAGSAS
jgi:hypothetical protein